MIKNLLTLLLLPLAVAVIVTVHSSCAVGVSSYLAKGFKNGRKLRTLKKRLRMNTKKGKPLEIKHGKRIVKVWLIFAGVVVFFGAMVLFELNGKKAAQTLLASIDNQKYNIVRPTTKKTGEELAYLYCGSRNCAGLRLETGEIVYFPQTGHSYLDANDNVTRQ